MPGVPGKESEPGSAWTFFLIVLGWTSGLQTRTGAKACVSQKLRGLGNGSDLAKIRQNVLDVRKQRDGWGKKRCVESFSVQPTFEGETLGFFVCLK